MKVNNIFLNQWSSGQWPTLVYNREERKVRSVDTLSITAMVIYLAQMCKQKIVNTLEINLALDFIMSKSYHSEIEGYLVWHFNSFYPPDWEDTAMAIYLLWKNRKLDLNILSGCNYERSRACLHSERRRVSIPSKAPKIIFRKSL